MQWKQVRIVLILVVIFTALWYVYPSIRTSDYWQYSPVRNALSSEQVEAIESDPLLTAADKTSSNNHRPSRPRHAAGESSAGPDLQGACT